MVTHTIEELHELFKSGELDVKEYYKEFPAMVKARDQILYASDMEKRYDSLRITKVSMEAGELVAENQEAGLSIYGVPEILEFTVSYSQLKDWLHRIPKEEERKSESKEDLYGYNPEISTTSNSTVRPDQCREIQFSEPDFRTGCGDHLRQPGNNDRCGGKSDGTAPDRTGGFS